MTATANDFDYSSPTVPEAALFVAADEPLLVFPSAKAAEGYLEPVDVENGVYPAAYGPGGEPCRIGCRGAEVVIERTGEPNRPDDLRVLLVRYLENRGEPTDATEPLDALVAKVWKSESEFWQEHDPYGERFGWRIPSWGCLTFILVVMAGLYVAFS